MRKLIVGSIIFVILFIVWTLYLEHDTKQFIQGLPQPREAETQYQDSTPQTRPGTPAKTDNTATETLENADDPFFSETPEDLTQETGENTSNTVFDVEAPDIESETSNSGLSPELETLFSEYYPISQQFYEIAMELKPLRDTENSYKRRTLDILAALNGEEDEQIQKTLGDEFDAIKTRREELSLQIRELEDMRSQLAAQQDVLFAIYGLTDYRDFGGTYGDMFKTWQTQKGF